MYAEYLEVWYAQRCVERIPCLQGEGKHHRQYRHIIKWLIRKPGVFENYRYREELFPRVWFRMAYDNLKQEHTEQKAAKEYLRILLCAAREGWETRNPDLNTDYSPMDPGRHIRTGYKDLSILLGIEISRETLALDLINEVGPIPGFYLNKEHTREWWKEEQFIPKATDGLTYPEWMKIGKKGSFDYANERMEEIIKTHKVDPPLTNSQKKDIKKILEGARNYYNNKGIISKNEMRIYRKSTDHLYE